MFESWKLSAMEKTGQTVTNLPEELQATALKRGWRMEHYEPDPSIHGMMSGMPHNYWYPPTKQISPEESAKIAQALAKKQANNAEVSKRSINTARRNAEAYERKIKEEEVARCRAIVREANATTVPKRGWWGGRKTRRRHTKRRSTRSKRSNA
jgi:hypothetical protein